MKRATLIPIIIGAAGLAAVGATLLALRAKEPPRVNGKIDEIARYIDTPAFKQLPFDRQALYMKVLDSRREDLRNALHNKTLGDDEYRASIEYAWFGKQLAHMDRYYSLREGAERTTYLETTSRKRLKAKQGTPAATADASADELPKREQSSEKTYPLTWPADVRVRWDQYRKDLKKAEKKVERELIAESIKNPTTQAAKSGAKKSAKKKTGK